MTRKYSLIVEDGEGAYSAYVSELPTILVKGRSLEELTSLASEAIQIDWSTVNADRSPTSVLREIEAELPV